MPGDSAPDPIQMEFMRRMLAGQTLAELAAWIDSVAKGAPVDNQLPGWNIRTAEHALEPKEPQRYLIDQVLPYPSLSIVYGGPGTLKSMLLADLCACIAGGIPFLEPLPGQLGAPLQCTQAPVLWIDFDNGTRRTDIRIGAILRAHALGPETPFHYVSMPVPHLDAGDLRHVDTLIGMAQQRGYRLIVIDNLGLVTGDAEENSAGMANVMGNLRRLAESAEVAVILIHHQRKSSATSEANGIRKGETLRGHSSIEASLDLALLIERKPGEDTITILPTKVRDYLRFTSLGARFTFEHAPDTADLWAARFFGEENVSAQDADMQQLRATILDIVRTQPGITQKTLIDEVRDRMAVMAGAKAPGVNRVRGTLKQLSDDGRLREGGNGGTRTYSTEN